jgi:hypothetical protein
MILFLYGMLIGACLMWLFLFNMPVHLIINPDTGQAYVMRWPSRAKGIELFPPIKHECVSKEAFQQISKIFEEWQ